MERACADSGGSFKRLPDLCTLREQIDWFGDLSAELDRGKRGANFASGALQVQSLSPPKSGCLLPYPQPHLTLLLVPANDICITMLTRTIPTSVYCNTAELHTKNVEQVQFVFRLTN